MTIKEKTGVDESDPDNKEGKGSDGAAGQTKIATVPLSVLEATRADLKGQLARAQLENDRLKAGQQKPDATTQAKTYTRTELRAMVNEGKITEDQMDAQLEAQLEAKFNKKVETTVEATAAKTRISAEVSTGIAAYLEAHPELSDPDSDIRGKVQIAFDKLIRRGAPEGPATELTAMENALGSLAPKGRKKEPETHEETGGSGDDDRSGRGANDGWAKGLSPAQKAHYQKQIDRGGYSGTTDKRLVAEVKIARERRAAH